MVQVAKEEALLGRSGRVVVIEDCVQHAADRSHDVWARRLDQARVWVIEDCLRNSAAACARFKP